MPSPRGSNREGLFLPARSAGAAYDANPDRGETVRDFMLRKGLSQDHVDAFEALCRVGDAENGRSEAVNTGADPYEPNAEDDEGDDVFKGHVNVLAKAIGNMDPGEAHGCEQALAAILRRAGDGAADMLPTGEGGTGLPRNRMQLEGRHAMDSARITTGSDTFGHGHDRGRVPMPADRKPKSDAAKFAPGISRIVIGV
jgi:hypothetical protein